MSRVYHDSRLIRTLTRSDQIRGWFGSTSSLIQTLLVTDSDLCYSWFGPFLTGIFSKCPGCLVTVASVKIWDIHTETPTLVEHRDAKLGTIICLASCPDLPFSQNNPALIYHHHHFLTFTIKIKYSLSYINTYTYTFLYILYIDYNKMHWISPREILLTVYSSVTVRRPTPRKHHTTILLILPLSPRQSTPPLLNVSL